MPDFHWRFLPLSRLLWLGLLNGCAHPFAQAQPRLVTGQVVDRHTGKPVAGATVQLYAQTGSGLAVGGYGVEGKPHVTDEKGTFSFPITLAKDAQYLVLAQAPPAYHTLWGEAPVLDRRHPSQGLQVPMQAPAYIRIRLQDDPPSSRVSISVYGYASHVDEFRQPVTSTYVRTLDAGEKRRINWEILDENGALKTGGQDLLISSLDTQTVTIHF